MFYAQTREIVSVFMFNFQCLCFEFSPTVTFCTNSEARGIAPCCKKVRITAVLYIEYPNLLVVTVFIECRIQSVGRIRESIVFVSHCSNCTQTPLFVLRKIALFTPNNQLQTSKKRLRENGRTEKREERT